MKKIYSILLMDATDVEDSHAYLLAGDEDETFDELIWRVVGSSWVDDDQLDAEAAADEKENGAYIQEVSDDSPEKIREIIIENDLIVNTY